MAKERSSLLTSEDWWAVWFGLTLIAVATVRLVTEIPKPGTWTVNPFDGLPVSVLLGLVALFVGLGLLTASGFRVMGLPVVPYLRGFAVVFLLALLAKLTGQHTMLK
ncbi:MAG: hypothetical protein D6690_10580, partial [Nitrospirae bacterium]